MSEKNISEINIIYDIKRKNNIKIFGSKFVKNNKNICKMIIDNKEYELAEKYKVKGYNKKLKIKLKGINHITNMSDMFSDCSSLSSLPDISKWNTTNVYNMSYMFSYCSSLSSLPDISKWNTNKAINMSYMFYFCSSLSSLPDISKWNTNNVTNMNEMFYGCLNLTTTKIIIKKFNINKI